MNKVLTQSIGFPRIGRRRELKRALEAFWAGSTDETELRESWAAVEESGWQVQRQAGLERIGAGDSSLYDPMLDWAVRLGAVPARHRGQSGLARTFAMARGTPGAPALELTKWFDTNYHYLVPEISADWNPVPDFADYLATVRRAVASLQSRAVPVVIGPLTFLRLARLELPIGEALARVLPAYRQLLRDLAGLRAALPGTIPEVQFHEPALVLPNASDDRLLYENAYRTLSQDGLPLVLVSYFDDLGEAFAWASRLPVATLHLDFTRGDNLSHLRSQGWPGGTELSAGLIDGRNVWQADPSRLLALAEEIRQHAPIRVSPSCSLQFVPYSVRDESSLPQGLAHVLAFAEEKLHETRALADRLNGESKEDVRDAAGAWTRFRSAAPARPGLAERIRSLAPGDFERSAPYVERRPRQIALPPLPTTTIGSFPQTREIRALRRKWKGHSLDEQAYLAGIDEAIRNTIRVQEDIGLDVLVHGEFERSDMVEYFAERLEGFAFTENGWVQSYGSRCVRPPIIYQDIYRTAPLTVREFSVAQSATDRPVKGMLTGPITILNWSYPRPDLARRDIAFQIALALREEISDLEAAGARVVQVDEPALREGLPLRPDRRAAYLEWAVDAFRLATAAARPETQVHTHMCYGDFGDVLGAIDRLDADVISLENARSGDETLAELAQYGYPRQVGPGVYDVHSPAVLPLEAAITKLRTIQRHLRSEQIWVNPDCGLKTRDWPEVIESLRNLAAAARTVREESRAAESA